MARMPRFTLMRPTFFHFIFIVCSVAGPALCLLLAPRTAQAQTFSTLLPVVRSAEPGSPPRGLEALENEVITLINRERTQRGCPALTAHPTLRAVAYAHSQDMAERGFFDHVNPDGADPGERLLAAGYATTTWGENIAGGQTTPAEVVGVWLGSEAHRRNTLNCAFLDAGIGYFYAPDIGYWHYWTLILGRQPAAAQQLSPSFTPVSPQNPALFLPLMLR